MAGVIMIIMKLPRSSIFCSLGSKRCRGSSHAMGKRKSGGGGGAPKVPRIMDLHVPVDALLKEAVQRFDKWLLLGQIGYQYMW